MMILMFTALFYSSYIYFIPSVGVRLLLLWLGEGETSAIFFIPLLECVHCRSFSYIRARLIRLTKWGCRAIPFPIILIELSSLQCHPQAKWLECVCSEFLTVLLHTTPNMTSLSIRNAEAVTSEEYEAQRQMQRYIGIFSPTACIAATASNLYCWRSSGLLMLCCDVRVCMLLHSTMWTDISPKHTGSDQQQVPAFCEHTVHICECWTGFLLSRSHLHG